MARCLDQRHGRTFTHRSEQLLDSRRNDFRARIVQEMASIDDAYIRIWQISLERLSSGRDEEGVTLAPYCYKLWLILSKIRLPFRIGLHIRLIILHQVINLDLKRAWSRHVVDVEVGSIRRYTRIDPNTIRTFQSFR